MRIAKSRKFPEQKDSFSVWNIHEEICKKFNLLAANRKHYIWPNSDR